MNRFSLSSVRGQMSRFGIQSGFGLYSVFSVLQLAFWFKRIFQSDATLFCVGIFGSLSLTWNIFLLLHWINIWCNNLLDFRAFLFSFGGGFISGVLDYWGLGKSNPIKRDFLTLGKNKTKQKKTLLIWENFIEQKISVKSFSLYRILGNLVEAVDYKPLYFLFSLLSLHTPMTSRLSWPRGLIF